MASFTAQEDFISLGADNEDELSGAESGSAASSSSSSGNKGKGRAPAGSDDDDEEDDFMSDKYLQAAEAAEKKAPKSYSQMRKAAIRRGEERGHVKSRAEREREAREEGLRRNLLAPTAGVADSDGAARANGRAKPQPQGGNKALDMMLKMGFKPGEALGKKAVPGSTGSRGASASASATDDDEDEDDLLAASRGGLGARKRAAPSHSPLHSETPAGGANGSSGKGRSRIEPLEIQMRAGRSGLGVDEAKRRRLAALASTAATQAGLSVTDYRTRARDEHAERRAEGLLKGARKTCRDLDEQPSPLSEGDTTGVPGPVRWNVLWLDPHEERERAREAVMQARRHGGHGARTRLGDFGAEEGDEDNVLGDDQSRRPALCGSPDGLEDEALTGDEIVQREEETEQFCSLDARERLSRTVAYLRQRHNYCLWCGTQYSSKQDLEAECPGEEEGDH